ncbi:MAG: Rrf2 family transcriptional regulator [Pseudomonadota bacterium]
MPRDSRLSRMLHVLIHMDQHMKKAKSDDIAKMLGTNPVVVRRMMAGLRDLEFVTSEKGHGGGWKLTCGLDAITLKDVYDAMRAPPLFNIGASSDAPDCLVEQAVDARIDGTLSEAEALLMARFEAITVADIADDFLRAAGLSETGAQNTCAVDLSQPRA